MTTHTDSSAQTLVAIALAARKSGDRDLERQAVRELRERHGIRLSLGRQERGEPAR